MNGTRRFHGGPVPRARVPAALAVVLIVVTACQSSATPSPSVVASAPASVAPSVPATSAEPQPAPTPSALSAAAEPGWVAAGSTVAWRRDPLAVRLSGDRVLVVGSVEVNEGTEIQTTAEIWDPKTNTWAATDGLPKGRTEFIAVAIGNDRVLVAGGLNTESKQQSYSSAYIYDGAPGKGTWTKTGLMGAARTAPSAAVLPDGRVLVAGGYFYAPTSVSLDDEPIADLADFRVGGGSGTRAERASLLDIDPGIGGAALATAELFDPATGTWSPTGAMHYARTDASAVTLADGRVLIAGSGSSSGTGFGIQVDGHAFATAEIYDPASGRFSLAGSMPKIDRAALTKQGTKSANPLPDDDGDIGAGPLVALPDGGAVMIGVTGYWKHVADMTRSVRFDASTGKWSEIGKTYVFVGEPTAVPLWTPGVPALVGARIAPLPDGRVLVAGGQGPNLFGDTGFNATPSTAATEIFDPGTNAFSPGPPMPTPRSGGASVVLSDGSVLLVDGTIDTADGGSNVTSAIRYVP
jgi:hypothetical protein